MKELKIGLKLNLQIQEAIEYYAIKSESINQQQFEDFEDLHIDAFVHEYELVARRLIEKATKCKLK